MIRLILAPIALAAFIVGIATGAIVAFVRAPPSTTTRIVYCHGEAECQRLLDKAARGVPPPGVSGAELP